MKRYILTGLMLCSLLLTSCAEPRLLDELNISQAAGFDLLEDGEMKGFFVSLSLKVKNKEVIKY